LCRPILPASDRQEGAHRGHGECHLGHLISLFGRWILVDGNIYKWKWWVEMLACEGKVLERQSDGGWCLGGGRFV
jgi:hypothetical protein